MTEEEHEGNWYILLHGIELESDVMQLAPGLSLVKLNEELTVFDLAAAGSVGMWGWSMLEPFASGCKCEMESAADASKSPGYDALGRAWLASAMLTLLGFGQHRALAASAYPWSVIAGHQKRTAGQFREQLIEEWVESAVNRPRRELPRFKGRVLESDFKMLFVQEVKEPIVTQAECDWIRDNFDKFDDLAAKSKAFNFGLMAAVEWRHLGNFRAAMAMIWSGIEAVIDVQSELAYRLSVVAASLLCGRGEERIKKYRLIRDLYSLRSKAVHGEELDEPEMAVGVAESFQLLRALLVRQVERGKVFTREDMNEAVLG